MKKRIVMLTLVVSMTAAMLAACGNKTTDTAETGTATENSTEEAAAEEETVKEYSEDAYLEGINIADVVTLGDYKGVEIEVPTVNVTDEDIDAYIEKVKEANLVKTEITDRAAEDGDLVNVDYEGKKDGVAFDGGTAADQEITVAGPGYIEGFTEAIAGMEIGETKDATLTFPEDYGNEELAGQEVVFTFTLNAIYKEEQPELNDEFVAGLAVEGVTTVDEFKKYVYNILVDKAETERVVYIETAVLKKVSENAEYKNIPAAMSERYYDTVKKNLTMQASLYGLDLDSFMLYGFGMSPEQYEEQMRASAEGTAKQIIAMQAIAEKEGLTISDDELEAKIKSNANDFGYESEEAYREAMEKNGGVKGLREYMMSEKISAFLVENAVVVDVEPEEMDSTEEAAETETVEETETTTETAETETTEDAE